jgi:hypothetical protein
MSVLFDVAHQCHRVGELISVKYVAENGETLSGELSGVQLRCVDSLTPKKDIARAMRRQPRRHLQSSAQRIAGKRGRKLTFAD